MTNIWYRGEGAGVPPSKPGGDLHDLGDGLYLTDTEDVAWQYARLRAPGYKEYRVWQANVSPQTLGRVLDLTTDSRWTNFMREPMVPGSRNPQLMKSRLNFLTIKNELYGQFFKEFLRSNKIDIKSYDAVIGPEYVRGGKQLCILNKNGLPTRLITRVRALLQPEPWAARVAATAEESVTAEGPVVSERPIPTKIGFPRAVGGFIVSVGISLLLAYLSQKVMQKVNQDFINKGMKALEPEIQKYSAARRRVILDNLSSGVSAYVTASVEIRFMNTNVPETGDVIPGLPTVHLDSLGITAKDWSGSDVKHDQTHFFGGYTDIYEMMFSVEAKAPQEDVERYNDTKRQLKWYEDTIKNPNLIQSDRSQLRKEYEALQDWRAVAFGKMDEFVPNRALWTEEGYAGISGKSE